MTFQSREKRIRWDAHHRWVIGVFETMPCNVINIRVMILCPTDHSITSQIEYSFFFPHVICEQLCIVIYLFVCGKSHQQRHWYCERLNVTFSCIHCITYYYFYLCFAHTIQHLSTVKIIIIISKKFIDIRHSTKFRRWSTHTHNVLNVLRQTDVHFEYGKIVQPSVRYVRIQWS